ncbi:MAG: response regulator [Campylobacterota bacterium]|nr:response regulator [Campylobacterota bacterium]
MRVMIVDDSPTIVKIVSMLLEKKIDKELEIVKCNSGEVALKKLKDIEIDLILLDVIMDGMNGFETCQKIKENLQTKDIPVIFLTSKSEEENIIKGFEVGGIDYISKPFREMEFIARVKTQLKIVKLQKREIESTQSEVIFKMGEIGESRSEETANHVKRVAKYSYLLAELCGLEEKECRLLATASPMHDIGKVSIPDNILKKPGKLTKEEFTEMQKHTTIGYELFANSRGKILKTAAIVAHEHHEKYNGKGYPRGLKGSEIHIYGRITAVVDVFDALGSERVYKKAWELDRILSLLLEEKGEHFDPHLVDLFVENIDKFLAIRDKFKD